MTGRDSPSLTNASFLHPEVYPSTMRDPKRAQKVLGLGSGVPALSRRGVSNPEVDETMRKAKRMSGFVVSDAKDRKSWCASVAGSSSYSESLEERLRQAEDDVRRLSGMDSLIDHDESIITWNMRNQSRQSTSTRGWSDIGLQGPEEEKSRQYCSSPRPSHLSLSSLSSMPRPLFAPSPELKPVELDSVATQHFCQPATRSRQSSCASSRFHARPTNKIASSRSRGLRSDTFSSSSRPTSAMMKTVPGEDMERDPLYLRYAEELPTPQSPSAKDSFAFDDVKEARDHIEQQLKLAMENHGKSKPKNEPEPRPKKQRWASLPSSLFKLTKRHSKPEEELTTSNHTKHHPKKKDKHTLTTENLQRWEDEVGHAPTIYSMGTPIPFVSSPVEVDITINETCLPTPRSMPSPQFQDLGPTPPASPSLSQPNPYQQQQQQQQRQQRQQRPHHFPSSSFSHRSPSPLLTPPPERRSLLSLASHKEFAAEKANALFTCTVCKEAEHPSTFPLRRITKACMHPTRTCLDCLRGWIDMCIKSGRWEGCTCPECGLTMSEEDVEAFSSAGGFMR